MPHPERMIRGALAVVALAAVCGCGVTPRPVGASSSPSATPAATPNTSAAPVETPSLSPSPTAPTTTSEPTPDAANSEGFSPGSKYEWSDGVEVSIVKVTFSKMTKADVEDVDPDGRVGQDLVRFYIRVKNGSTDALDDVAGDVTVSYGADGEQAEQRFTEDQDFEEFGTIRAGRAKTISETYAIPRKAQKDVTLDFDLDLGTHEIATFNGAVR